VGGSCSGKTFLVRQMILRKDLGVAKKCLRIIVTSPVEASLQQKIWKDLALRGYDIRRVQLGKTQLGPSSDVVQRQRDKDAKKTLLIVDDVDHVTEIRKGREWLMDLFGTESHHSDISVILIAHHLRIGCPAIRASADAVVICSLPPFHLKQVIKELGLDVEEEDAVSRALADPEGAPLSGAACGDATAGDSYTPLFNHVVVWRRPLFLLGGKKGSPVATQAPTLYRMPRLVSERPELTPI